jgi:hypothetical protein
MSAYRLLRNNKESGPFSLEEITAIGFKPYDLIWVDNKSAAWRYPYEIAELKPFTNFTEEQPYDRFYKKTSDVKEQTDIKEQTEVKEKVMIEADILTETIVEKKIEQPSVRKIFVSLPANSSLPANKEKPVTIAALKPVAGVKTTLPSSYAEFEKEATLEYKQPAAEAAVLTEKYSQPLDEIKKMYVDKLLNNKRSKNNFADKKKYLQIAAVVVVLLGLGIFIGSAFNKPGNKTIAGTSPNKQTSTLPLPNEKTGLSNAVIPVKENITADDETNSSGDVTAEPAAINDELTTQQKKKQEELLTPVKTIKKEKQLPVTNKSVEKTQEQQPSDIDPVTGERKKTVRTEEVSPPKPKEDIWKMVSVKSNEYKRGSFGGISNLQMTVNNNSGYILDEVIIEIQYLKPSLEPLKKETIRFSYVAPNGTMTIKVPDSKRGIKISYSITGINSRQYQAAYAGL